MQYDLQIKNFILNKPAPRKMMSTTTSTLFIGRWTTTGAWWWRSTPKLPCFRFVVLQIDVLAFKYPAGRLSGAVLPDGEINKSPLKYW